MTSRPNNPIDFWKGITILSVLNIHTCFWSGGGYLPPWTRQAALMLDVPVFFFISGYLLSNRETGTVLRRGGRQVIRLLADYFVVAIAAVLLLTGLRVIAGKEPLPDAGLTFSSILTLNPRGSNWGIWKGFGPSLWYLHVYLSLLVCGLPILVVARSSTRGLILGGIAALTASASMNYGPPFLLTTLKSVSFYLSIFLFGAALKANAAHLTIRWHRRAWTALICSTVVVIAANHGIPDFQSAKFPPSPAYFVLSSYSVLVFCGLVSCGARSYAWSNPNRFESLVCWCGQNSYRIYLWQGIAASVPFLFVPKLLAAGTPVAALYLVTLGWNVVASLVLVSLHNRIESFVSHRVKARLPDRSSSITSENASQAPTDAGAAIDAVRVEES